MRPVATLVFLSGAGLNAEPDRRALEPLLERAGIASVFWHEPSAQRPAGPPWRAERALENVHEHLAECVRGCAPPVTLAGQSLGAFTVTRLLRDADLRAHVRDVVLLGPVFDVVPAHRAILRLCRADFEKTAPDKARRIDEALTRAATTYDEHFQEGLALAMENPALLTHYFGSDDVLRAWSGVAAEPAWGIDGPAMDAYLRDLAAEPPLPGPLDGVACQVVFGDRDPVARPEDARAQLDRSYPGWRLHVVPGAGHFPHLEAPETFLRILDR